MRGVILCLLDTFDDVFAICSECPKLSFYSILSICRRYSRSGKALRRIGLFEPEEPAVPTEVVELIQNRIKPGRFVFDVGEL